MIDKSVNLNNTNLKNHRNVYHTLHKLTKDLIIILDIGLEEA